MWFYLQYSTHPLEAVLLTGVRPLLCHNHYPLIIKHRHREHSNPAGTTTKKLALTHRERLQDVFSYRGIYWSWKRPCLTSPCKLFWPAPLPARWPPGRRRCGAARSPSAAPRSSPQQTPDCPVERQHFQLSEECFALFLQSKFRKITLYFCLYNRSVCLTGPTNPSRPVRENGISPMGAPAWLTGIT